MARINHTVLWACTIAGLSTLSSGSLRMLRILPLAAGLWVCLSMPKLHAHAQSAPSVTAVRTEQVQGTGKVRVTYDLTDADGGPLTVTLRVSDNGGQSFVVPSFHCTGDVYNRVAPGPSRQLVWDAGRDVPGRYGETWQVEVTARDGTIVDVLPDGVPIEFVRIDPGTFLMGSQAGYSNEVPVHEVTLTQPFYLGVYEITQAQYECVMGAGTGPWVGQDLAQEGPFYPAAYVSWDDLQAFLGRLNETAQGPGNGDNGTAPPLPTEAVLVDTLPDGTTIEFVWIEPGTFMMGAPGDEPGYQRNEGPQHQVTLSEGYYLGRFEVTQGQWGSVMGTRPWAGKEFVREGSDRPAVYLEWADAQAFTETLNAAVGEARYRLPTEAEWEYAARAGTLTRWSFGDDETELGDHAWYRANAWDVSRQYAMTVGTKRPNPWGLYDVHGNLWEWVQDRYDEYASVAQTDPQGPLDGAYRVLRGGSFGDFAPTVRVAARLVGTPHPRRYIMGTRLWRRGPRETPCGCAKPVGVGTEEEPLYRLATEAEWEYAARAGTTTMFSFGDDVERLADYAWYRPNCADQREHYGHLVGTRLPNPWGLYDMHGNLWEWLQDLYGPYLEGPQTDPTGPAAGAFNVRRGGGFANANPKDLSSSRRGDSAPYNCGWCMGARLARNPTDALTQDGDLPAAQARGTREGRGRSDSFVLDTRPATAVEYAAAPDATVDQIALHPNAPNPFNTGTLISYSLPGDSWVELAIYNLAGQKVATLLDGRRSAGSYTVRWDGRGDSGQVLASSVYLCHLRTATQSRTRQLLLLH